MTPWAAKELKYADLGDARLNKRLVKIVEDLATHPNASVTEATANWSEAKSTYRFWQNQQIRAMDIIEAQQMGVVERIKDCPVVLALQDTTDLSFSHHASKTAAAGFGPISSSESALGLKVHSTFAVNTEGVPLGLLDQKTWAREPSLKGKTKKKQKRSLFEKESKKWFTGLTATELSIPDETVVVTIADREADIYDLFALERRPNSHLLIRAQHNRKVTHPSTYLKAAIAQTEAAGEIEVEIPRAKDLSSRIATVTIRCAELSIKPPAHSQSNEQLQPLTVNVIWLCEENPPLECSSPISWLLLTTLPIKSLSDAARYVRWYTFRWLIERYHYTLKSGCRIEELQLETADRIERALATYSIVAWRLLWLTYEARINPESSCERVLETYEWQALYARIHQSKKIPTQPPSFRQAVRWIAQLGGFLGRKGDKEPGVKTIWRGLRRLNDLATGWELQFSRNQV